MLDIAPIFYSIFAILVPVAGSVILIYRIKKNKLLHARKFFLSHAIAFALLALVNLPVFFINLRLFEISYKILLILYAVSFLAVLLAYLFFYRGTSSLFIKNRFFTEIAPMCILAVFAVITIALLFGSKIETSILYTVGVWGFIVPMDAILALFFLHFFIKGLGKRFISHFILSIAWFLNLLLQVYLWLDVATFAVQKFWILKIASNNSWFLAWSFVHILILIACLFLQQEISKNDMAYSE